VCLSGDGALCQAEVVGDGVRKSAVGKARARRNRSPTPSNSAQAREAFFL
jgi:hypothetical protein